MAHMYIHHNNITIHFFFLHIFYFPGQAGCTQLALSATVHMYIQLFSFFFPKSVHVRNTVK
jgi:hypothetical protein